MWNYSLWIPTYIFGEKPYMFVSNRRYLRILFTGLTLVYSFKYTKSNVILFNCYCTSAQKNHMLYACGFWKILKLHYFLFLTTLPNCLMKSSFETVFDSFLLYWRTLTALFATSSSPTTNWNGIFCIWASRIL